MAQGKAEAALTAALIAAGMSEPMAILATTINYLRRQGAVELVYGLSLPRRRAILLREQVTAIEDQTKKQLRTYESALTELRALGIDEENALALTSAWAAETAKHTTTGTARPI